jgi:hypothetical protein
MRILIVYELPRKTDRNTIFEHLNSFKKFGPENEYHYLNVFNKIPYLLKFVKYDLIVFHYTFLAGSRFFAKSHDWETKTFFAKELQGYKIAIPQDEYDHTNRLNNFFREANIKEIYTCYTKDEDIKKAYGDSGVSIFHKVFTGYVDETQITLLNEKALPFSERVIDIGYRARQLPAYFGQHGQLKYELVLVFSKALLNFDFVSDILNTNDNQQKENKKSVKNGDSWYEFLLSCKSFIGCEGGSSLLDIDGSIKSRVLNYVKDYPNANFHEIERECFPNQDNNIACFAISPRHFEAALCKTLQILVEGEYGGVFKPWVHYLPLKRDFSNVNEILERLKDNEFCQLIVDNAYSDIVMSDKYTYRNFVANIYANVSSQIQPINKTSKSIKIFNFLGVLLDFRNELGLISKVVKNIFLRIFFIIRSRVWWVISFFYSLFFAKIVRDIRKTVFNSTGKIISDK